MPLVLLHNYPLHKPWLAVVAPIGIAYIGIEICVVYEMISWKRLKDHVCGRGQKSSITTLESSGPLDFSKQLWCLVRVALFVAVEQLRQSLSNAPWVIAVDHAVNFSKQPRCLVRMAFFIAIEQFSQTTSNILRAIAVDHAVKRPAIPNPVPDRIL